MRPITLPVAGSWLSSHSPLQASHSPLYAPELSFWMPSSRRKSMGMSGVRGRKRANRIADRREGRPAGARRGPFLAIPAAPEGTSAWMESRSLRPRDLALPCPRQGRVPTVDDAKLDCGAVWTLDVNASGSVDDQLEITDGLNGFENVLDDEDEFGSAVATIGDLGGNGTTDLAAGGGRA